jgi:hypothetical protein
MIPKKELVELLKKDTLGSIDDLNALADKIIAAYRKFTASLWLDFQLQVRKEGRSTDTYHVKSTETEILIGKIKWHPVLKCYSFLPEPDTNFETTALEDITAFLFTLMDEWRKSKRIEPQDSKLK